MVFINIILATNNNNKKLEFNRILNPLGYNICALADEGIDIEIDETGTTFEDNAIIKARSIYDIKRCPIISDDSGLEVDYLDGRPGVYSARYGGDKLSDNQRCELLLKELRDVPFEKRTARFVCVICYIDSSGDLKTFFGKCEGKIGFELKGSNGFGYDNVFLFSDDTSKSFAEIDGKTKDFYSHRSKASKKLIEYLNFVK